MTIVVLAGLIAFGFWLPEADAYNDNFEDGGTHIIDYDAGNAVEVRDGPNGETTTVIVTSGGQIWWTFHLLESSKAYITGGLIGGAGQGWLVADQTSSFIISGGEIKRDFLARWSSKSTISGGLFRGAISAGYYEDSPSVNHAEITIIGRNFKVCGQRVEPGTYTVSNSPFGPGHLTGTLANGDPLDNVVCIYGNSSIVLVLQPTVPPIADAGSDQTVMDADDNGSEVVTLDGGGSSDSDGSIIIYVWSEGGNQIVTGVNPNITLSIGTHTITLTVTDDDGATNTDIVIVTVQQFPNQPPVADADGPYTIYVGDTLTLDASGSTDDDNNIVSYLWDLDDNNSFETDAGINPVFDVNFAYLQSIGLLVDNTYNIHLKVTDSVGQSDVNDSTLTILPIPALQVFVDIKPGSCPNPLNVKSSGVLPVAILGTADFDITTIDPTSIRLAGVEPLRNGLEDVSGPAADSNDCNCSEDGPDGFLDLTLKFKTQKIVEAIGDVNEGDVLSLVLTGVLIGERPIEGADCILIRGGHKPFNKADINKDGKVDCSDFAIFAQNWLQSSIVED
jgi:hypothetical protein